MSTACVFSLCNSVLTMVAELKQPGSNEALRRVPQHRLGGHEEFGQCPASLMLLPLSEYDSQQLVEQARIIGRILEEREGPGSDESMRSLRPDWREAIRPPEAYRPGRRPRPADKPHWFTERPPGETTGQRGYDPMPQVLTPRQPPGWLGPSGSSDDTSTKGGSDAVTSVREVKAMITRAGELMAQASDALFAIEGQVSEAAQLLNVVRETSSSEMGAPEVVQAIEKIGEANELLRRAMEIGTTYRSTL